MHYRLGLPWGMLAKRGLAVARVNADTVDERNARIESADVLVFQSPASEMMLRYAEAKRESGSSQVLVVEHDDNPYAVSPFNPSYVKFGTEDAFLEDDGTGTARFLWRDGESGFDIKRNDRLLRRFESIMGLADLVTTTTKPLAAVFAERGARAVAVLPNCIDLNVWKPISIPHDGIRMGWQGGFSHYEDLMVLKDVLPDLPDGVVPVVSGWTPPVLASLCGGRLESHGWVHIEAHPYKQAMLALDFAVIPLVDNEFNACKSAIKWVEYSALGVPVVASNVGPYAAEIVDGETGLLVPNEPAAWKDAISRMTKDGGLRKRLGENARADVARRFDVNARAEEWLLAYQSVMEANREPITALA